MTELSTGQQILDRVKTADDIEEYLDFCVRDLTNDENYRSKKSKERLISRISGFVFAFQI
jgi:hypothetical protein